MLCVKRFKNECLDTGRKAEFIPIKGHRYTIGGFNYTDKNFVWLDEFGPMHTYHKDGFAPIDNSFSEEVCENAIKEAKEEEKQLIEELTNI